MYKSEDGLNLYDPFLAQLLKITNSHRTPYQLILGFRKFLIGSNYFGSGPICQKMGYKMSKSSNRLGSIYNFSIEFFEVI